MKFVGNEKKMVHCSSCKEIFYLASQKDEELGLATVYRMVNVLEEIGVISRKIVYEDKEESVEKGDNTSQ